MIGTTPFYPDGTEFVRSPTMNFHVTTNNSAVLAEPMPGRSTGLPQKLTNESWDLDLNGDGVEDIATVNTGLTGTQINTAVSGADSFHGAPEFPAANGWSNHLTTLPAASEVGSGWQDGMDDGVRIVDFNLDGLPDLVEVNLSAPVRVWRNVGAGTAEAPAPMGHWVAWRVRDPGSPNRDAIGAQVDVRVGKTPIGRRELVVGGGHIGGQLGWTTTGIGRATEAEIRVTWPDGEQGPWQQVAGDSFVTIERGAAAPVPWTPPARTGSS